jgi:hypothetical protein
MNVGVFDSLSRYSLQQQNRSADMLELYSWGDETSKEQRLRSGEILQVANRVK